MSTLQRRVAAIAVLLLALCGVMISASGAQASPPRYAAIKAGPGSEYPMIGYYDSRSAPQPQCWAPPESTATNGWLRVTYGGVTGFAADVPYGSIHRGENTPTCPPQATCGVFRNSIVQWSNGPGRQNTSWYVGPDCTRTWIPDIETYWCLRDQGVPDRGVRSAAELDALIDLWGVHARCLRQVPPG